MKKEILNRFEIIQNALNLEDFDLVEYQVSKLKVLELDSQAKSILDLLVAKLYKNINQLIDQYKQDKTKVTIYEDPEIQKLLLEKGILEDELAQKIENKNEYERYINEYNSEYFKAVGELLDKILQLRMHLAAKEGQESEKYKQAEETYNEYKNSVDEEQNEPTSELSEDKLQELKKAYKQAAQLCHPDKLSEEQKELGAEYFKELSKSYQHNDLLRVQEILHALQNEGLIHPTSDVIRNKELLLERIKILKIQIDEISQIIFSIVESEIFKHIRNISDRSAHFKQIKTNLESELVLLIEQTK